jgi:hypothetical protein
VHNSPEADDLNRDLGAKAFTTGEDIFFREDSYDPNTSSGQELITHELAHVVQQGTGAVSNSESGMSVNPPGDKYEKEADHLSQAFTNSSISPEVQRQEEEEEEMQMQEEEEIQMQEEEEEEEELLQAQQDEEEEIML